MNLWQKYIRSKMVKIQERAKKLRESDRKQELEVLERDKFADLRELMKEDLRKAQYSLLGGLREEWTMQRLCDDYGAAIHASAFLLDVKLRFYVRNYLGPQLAQYGYEAMQDTLGRTLFSFRQGNDVMTSFPRGLRGAYECECLLAKLEERDVPEYDGTALTKRVEDFFYGRPSTEENS